MKKLYKIKYLYFLLLGILLIATSCQEFLDKQPLDSITPDVYLATEADLAAYTIAAYNFDAAAGYSLGDIIHGDDHTDNQAKSSASSSKWVKGEWRVPNEDGNWGFGRIRNCNYFFEQVLPRWKSNAISGNVANIDHYIGEMYFLRAYEYYKKLKLFGDFPIIKHVLTDDKSELIEASKRSPRNEVARFIIQDLDSAIMLLQPSFANKNRITQNAALLFKSRVALFEGSWLKYHNGTPRVPGNDNWPGAPFNEGFSINIENEIEYFLTEAMEASKLVADKLELTNNSGTFNPNGNPYGWNDYFEMFSSDNPGGYDEVIFWKDYSTTMGTTHGISTYVYFGGNNTGFTKSYIDGFLMKNGLPIYASGSGYHGDTSIMEQKSERDERLQLFVVGEEDVKWLSPYSEFSYPKINNVQEERCVTGFHVRKFYSYDDSQLNPSAGGVTQDYGIVIFRAAEAYLNYIEASYMKNNALDQTAISYWKEIRQRAGIDNDIQKTISNTDLSKEDDWAKYSGESLVDATLFNIRRERRNEFIGEGMRWDDLKRWRALDLVQDYIVVGFNVWDEAYKHYTDNEGNNLLEPNVNVSNISDGKYLYPYRIITTNNKVYDGYNWSKANYLSPLPIKEMQLTATDPNDLSTSVLYQNPYWPTEAGGAALE